MLKYSDNASALSSVFFRYRNDIDIYTEDENKDKEFYKKLFYRLLGVNLKVNDITPLGSKKNVITKCKEGFGGDRKKIFIVDGDIMLLNDTNEVHDSLFVLEKYCIENYLIDKNAVCEYVYSRCGIYPLGEIESKVDFDNWISEYREPLIDLFTHFAIKNLCKDVDNPECKNGNFELFNASKYHQKHQKQKNLKFSPEIVQSDILQLKKEIIDIKGEEFYNEKLEEFGQKLEYNNDTFLTYISGKSYLIPILQFKTSEIKGRSDIEALEVVKLNLVDKFDINSLNALKVKIEEICK